MSNPNSNDQSCAMVLTRNKSITTTKNTWQAQTKMMGTTQPQSYHSAKRAASTAKLQDNIEE